MNQDINIIKAHASSMGACRLIDDITSFESLSRLLMSPQGVEFLSKHLDQQTIELFRQYKVQIGKFGITVDAIRKVKANGKSHIFIGPTTRAIANCSGTSHVFTFIIIDGAQITINASSYAVIRLYNLGGHAEIINDGTAKILQ